MIIKANQGTYFVFDLDDTLYSEIDFLKSAFKFIARILEPKSFIQLYEEMFHIFKSGGNAFEYAIEKFPGKMNTIEELINLYRNHIPEISLKEGVLEMLVKIKSKDGKIGIITNGRSITQRNKMEALGLVQFIDETIISEEFGFEKPNEAVYKYFFRDGFIKQFYYFGDNIKNDFITPKKLDWCCIGVIDKNNIKKFNISEFSQAYLPHVFITDFREIEII